jgi:hypothetical protein
LDRTNWKWGKSNINILFLCIAYRGAAIPWTFRDPEHPWIFQLTDYIK